VEAEVVDTFVGSETAGVSSPVSAATATAATKAAIAERTAIRAAVNVTVPSAAAPAPMALALPAAGPEPVKRRNRDCCTTALRAPSRARYC